MRSIQFLALGLGLGSLLCGCGSSADGGGNDPVPAPVANDICAEQHSETRDGAEVTVCDALYDQAPLVHLPKSDATRAYAALNGTAFLTAEGDSYPYAASISMNDPEMERHALAIYELTLADGKVKSFRPAVVFDESVFVAPFMGHAFEGTISRRESGGPGPFAIDPSLPVRVEILSDTIASEKGDTYALKAVITNLDHAVTATDGSCMPALSSYGAEATFDAGATVVLGASRSPSMHNFGDDEFVFSVTVNGAPTGSMMSPAWFRGPADIIANSLSASGEYTGNGHGTPGYIPNLNLELATGGGAPCTP